MAQLIIDHEDWYKTASDGEEGVPMEFASPQERQAFIQEAIAWAGQEFQETLALLD